MDLPAAIETMAAPVEAQKPTLLDIDAANVKFTLGKATKGMTFHRVSIKGRPIQFTLLPRGQFTSAPWKPFVYGGDGTEQRLNISFHISEEQRVLVEALEEAVRDQLGLTAAQWNSCVKPSGDGGLWKCKLNVSGAKKTALSGVEVLPTSWPQDANAYITIYSMYSQSRASGLILEATAIEFAPQTKGSENPFA